MKKLMNALWRYARSPKGREQILYLFFGGLTTLCNFSAYYIFTRWAQLPLATANTLAWFISVLFAFITNKLFVFQSKSWALRVALPEAGTFFLARVLSFFLSDMAPLYLLVHYLHMNDLLAKILLNIFVIIFNYVASKWVIFRKDKKAEEPR